MPDEKGSFPDFNNYRREVDDRMNYNEEVKQRLLAELHRATQPDGNPASAASGDIRTLPYMPAPAEADGARQKTKFAPRRLAALAAAVAVCAALFLWGQLYYLPAQTPRSTAGTPTEILRSITSGTSVTSVTKESVNKTATSTSAAFPISALVDEKWITAFTDINITTQWDTADGRVVLFGSYKKNTKQGVAVVTDSSLTRYVYETPSQHGAITVKVLNSDNSVEVSGIDGHSWTFDLPGVFAEIPEGKSRIVDLESKWKTAFSQYTFTSEWITADETVVLFGAEKSNPKQGVAVVPDSSNLQNSLVYHTLYMGGALTIKGLVPEGTYAILSSADGTKWQFCLPDGFLNIDGSGTYTGKWDVITRLTFTEGTVISTHRVADNSILIHIRVLANYHSGTDPVDTANYPYQVGSIHEFILRKAPDKTLMAGENIVLYTAEVYAASDKRNPFFGAALMYTKQNGKYVDASGKTVSMPPKDYPNFDEVFNH